MSGLFLLDLFLSGLCLALPKQCGRAGSSQEYWVPMDISLVWASAHRIRFLIGNETGRSPAGCTTHGASSTGP